MGNTSPQLNLIPYQVHDLRNQNPRANEINLYGIKFPGADLVDKKIILWFKNDKKRIVRVTVLFDAKYENIVVQDGTIILSLKGLNNYQDLRTAIIVFMQFLNDSRVYNLAFQFAVDNQQQKALVDSITQELGIKPTFVEARMTNQRNAIGELESDLKNKNLSASGNTETIMGSDSKKYTVVQGEKVIENVDFLDIEEQKLAKLNELQHDQFWSRRLQTMTREEIDELLTRFVTMNKTQNGFERPTELKDQGNEVATVASNKAATEDGQVTVISNAPNVAIAKNNPSNSTSGYTLVEQQPDTKIQVSEAQVQTQTINTGGINNDSQSSSHNVGDMVEPGITTKDESSRELITKYFIDEENYAIYDSYEAYLDGNEPIGYIGQGYIINYEDYSLYDAAGKKLGSLESIANLNKTSGRLQQTRDKHKTKVRSLPPEKPYQSAAFANLSIIIFILSAFLLIGSVLLFVLS